MQNFFKRTKDFLTKGSTVAYAKDIAKAAVAGLVIGVLLAYTLPTLAGWAGVEVTAAVGEMSKPLWMGLFTSGWGAFSAAVIPMVNRCFDDKKTSASPVFSPFVTVEEASVEMCHAPELAQGGGLFCSHLEAKRAQAGSEIVRGT